jgi:uncharacterized membrane protein (UPF0127 family)
MSRNSARSFLIGMLLALLLPACMKATQLDRSATSERGLPLGDLEIRRDSRTLISLQVEIAETSETMAAGLMGVESLSDSEGMAFLSEAPSRDPFWMKDTLIPLDIAFWDGQGLIVDILQMDPCKADPCPLYNPDSDYLGALEVNQGLLGKEGVGIGDRVLLRRRRP